MGKIIITFLSISIGVGLFVLLVKRIMDSIGKAWNKGAVYPDPSDKR